MPLFKNLVRPSYICLTLGVTLFLFGLQYWLMASLPGYRDLSCDIGANLTLINLLFAFLTSVLLGVMLSGIVMLIRSRMMLQSLAIDSPIGIASLFTMLISVCTVCVLPFIFLLGITISLEFVTFYNIYIKIGGVFLLSGGLFLINRQLHTGCTLCQIGRKSS